MIFSNGSRDVEEVIIYMGFSKPTLLRFHETTLNHDVGGGFKQFVLFTREIGEMI